MGADNYVIITPAHNEEDYIRFTLDSVVAQTLRPDQWIVVDDGSTDCTANIVQSYCDKYPWIKLIRNSPPEKNRQGGGKVVRAFNCGYNALDIVDFGFIAKIDADLTLPTNYFEEVGRSFELDSKVGMCGGYLSEASLGKWKRMKSAPYHLEGAIKTYRKECLEQMGGLTVSLLWDGIDEMKTMSLGWIIKKLPLEVKHHRKMSTLINNGWKFSMVMGKQCYKNGYDLTLAICRSVTFGVRTKPYVITSLGFLVGFIDNWWRKQPKDVTPELESFIRNFQYSRIRNILGGRV